MVRRVMFGVMVVLAMLIAGCGDDSGDGGSADAGADQSDDASQEDSSDPEDAGDDAGDGAAPAGDAGTLTLGEETIEMESVGCFLEEQPRAGLGGTFEFSIQGRGSNAAGEPIVVDITRVRPDEDGGPLGNEEPHDEIKVDIGDPTSEEFVSYSGDGPVGTVTVDGSTVTASGVQASSLSGGETLEVGLDLGCTGF